MPLQIIDQLTPNVREWIRQTPAAALRAMKRSVLLVVRNAKLNVSGRLLRVQTGRGRASITRAVEVVGTSVRGRVGSNLDYMAAHEYGATIHAHIVRARRARALHWVQGGQDRFARWVQIPTIHLPARHWLGTAGEESMPGILELFNQEYARVFGTGTGSAG